MKQWMDSAFSGLVLVSMFAWSAFYVIDATANVYSMNWQVFWT